MSARKCPPVVEELCVCGARPTNRIEVSNVRLHQVLCRECGRHSELSECYEDARDSWNDLVAAQVEGGAQ